MINGPSLCPTEVQMIQMAVRTLDPVTAACDKAVHLVGWGLANVFARSSQGFALFKEYAMKSLLHGDEPFESFQRRVHKTYFEDSLEHPGANLSCLREMSDDTLRAYLAQMQQRCAGDVVKSFLAKELYVLRHEHPSSSVASITKHRIYEDYVQFVAHKNTTGLNAFLPISPMCSQRFWMALREAATQTAIDINFKTTRLKSNNYQASIVITL